MCYLENIRIMTNNVKRDTEIALRAGLMIKNYYRFMPDVLGLQECDALAYKEVVEPLFENYTVAGTDIDSNINAARTPILFKKDKFDKIEDWSNFLTARYTDSKTYSVVILKEKVSGKIFAVLNVHFAIIIGSYPKEIGTDSEVGNMWRISNAKQIIEISDGITKKYGNIPVILTGDFNSNSSSEPYKILTGVFDDSSVTAKEHPKKYTSTYHKVGVMPDQNGLPFDFIFVKKNTAFISSCSIIDDEDMINSTDHLAVVADINI